ncbi:hypothetical protein [Amycolatopsis anabasis]|uniref:hypothetical protein n=1 Tax=Amycolatopsis anabasis TaxID=1840409 RepID=UPI00131D64FC|nr:hypothetical protein [Amycolatopsis anabasis]
MDATVGQVSSARTTSLDGWDGSASDSFRSSMGDLGPKVDALRGGFGGAANAIDMHANDIDTVKSRMQQARDIATAAGLTVTEREILDPGPPPPEPGPISHNEPESPAQAGSRARAEKAWSDWVDKAKAYADASAVVIEARKMENDSQSLLLSYLGNVADKWHINSADFVTGLSAGYLARQSTWKASAAKYTAVADELAGLSRDATRGATQQASDLFASLIDRAKAKVAADQAAASRIGGWLDKLPGGAKKALTTELGRFIPQNAKYLRTGTAVIKKVPVVGTALTGMSVGLDVAQGKDVTTSIVSNGTGLLAGAWAGAGVGAAFGGPVGAVAGFLVSTGTGWAIEEFMSPDSQRALDLLNSPEVQEKLPWYLRNPLK